MPWINSTFEKPVWIWLHFNPQMCWKRRTVHRIGQFCSTKYWWGHSKGYFFMLVKKWIWNGNFSYCYNGKYVLWGKNYSQSENNSKSKRCFRVGFLDFHAKQYEKFAIADRKLFCHNRKMPFLKRSTIESTSIPSTAQDNQVTKYFQSHGNCQRKSWLATRRLFNFTNDFGWGN